MDIGGLCRLSYKFWNPISCNLKTGHFLLNVVPKKLIMCPPVSLSSCAFNIGAQGIELLY